MLRPIIVGAMIIATQILLISGLAHSQDEFSTPESRYDVRGMFVLRWPFGRTESSAPRVGFDFEMQRRGDPDYLTEDRDSSTGQLLPQFDAGSVRTWSLEKPEVTLPSGRQGMRVGTIRPESLDELDFTLPEMWDGEPAGADSIRTWSFGEPEFTLPENPQAEPEDERQGAEPQPLS